MKLQRVGAVVLTLAIACCVDDARTFATEFSSGCACNQNSRQELPDIRWQAAGDAGARRQLSMTVMRLVLNGNAGAAQLMCASSKRDARTQKSVASGLAVAHVVLSRAGKTIEIRNRPAADIARSIFDQVIACGHDKFIKAFRERVVEERFRGNWGRDKGGDCRAPPCTAG